MFRVYNIVFHRRLIVTSYRIYIGVPVPLLLNNSGRRSQIRGEEALGVAMGGDSKAGV